MPAVTLDCYILVSWLRGREKSMAFDLGAVVQTFREKASQPERLISRLVGASSASLSIQILVNDDSGEQQALWRRHLRSTDVYVSSENIHETRAYNKLARLANATYLVFLQGDNCLPQSAIWLHEALYLFSRLPRLAILGGHAGFDDPSLSNGFGPFPRRAPIPFYVHGFAPISIEGSSPLSSPHSSPRARTNMNARHPIAFAHVYGVNIGPYFVRKRPFLDLGGFTEAYGGVGEPGGTPLRIASSAAAECLYLPLLICALHAQAILTSSFRRASGWTDATPSGSTIQAWGMVSAATRRGSVSRGGCVGEIRKQHLLTCGANGARTMGQSVLS